VSRHLNCNGTCDYNLEKTILCNGICQESNLPCNGKCPNYDYISCNGTCVSSLSDDDMLCNGKCQNIRLPCNGHCAKNGMIPNCKGECEYLPGVNFINVLRSTISYISLFDNFYLVTFGFVIFGVKILYKKCAQKNVDEIDGR